MNYRMDENRFETAIKEKVDREPDSLVPYCVLFISMTGVRAGEGVAITLEAISNKYKIISLDEKRMAMCLKSRKTVQKITNLIIFFGPDFGPIWNNSFPAQK